MAPFEGRFRLNIHNAFIRNILVAPNAPGEPRLPRRLRMLWAGREKGWASWFSHNDSGYRHGGTGRHSNRVLSGGVPRLCLGFQIADLRILWRTPSVDTGSGGCGKESNLETP